MLAMADEEMLGVWTMRDVDILVRAPEAQERLAEALRKCGYRTAQPMPSVLHNAPALIHPVLHHAPVLIHPELRIPVDLHKDVGIQRKLLSSEDAIAAAVEVNGLLVPRPVHMMAHNCFNSQVQDRAFELGVIPLKALVQLDWLLRHEKYQQIDWGEFWSRMRGAGCSTIACVHLEMSRWLLRTPVPELRRSRLAAQLHRKRCTVQLRYPSITRLFKFWISITPNLNQAVLEYYGRRQSGVSTLLSHFAKKAIEYRWHLPSLVRSVWRNTQR